MIGKHHRTLVDELQAWFDAGPPVFIVQGFSGSGKPTVLVPALVKRIAGRATAVVAADVPESKASQHDDLMMSLSGAWMRC